MTRRVTASMIALLLALHAAAILVSHQDAGISGLFVLACSISAALACHHRSKLSSGPVHRKWDFLASAFSLWSIGQAIQSIQWFVPSVAHFEVNVLGPEFYFLVYGIPVLLAVSTSNEERDSVLFVLIDSFQAIFAVVLVYAEIRFTEKAAGPGAPIGPTFIYICGSGAWLLAIAAFLRRLARPRGEERTLYRILLAYLFCFAILATPWHGSWVLHALPLGEYRNLLADLTFMLVVVGCLRAQVKPQTESAPIEMNSFALVLNNGSPILFTLAVLALGAVVARTHFGLGIAAIAISLVIYCFRAALLQSAYMNAQHALTRSQYALREANARLKQLSMHDALTGLPNRRQFDQTLELEWHRASRNRRPLSLLILDVDCFKALNDSYGHQAGDECLARIAGALQSSLRRAGDIAARYGGEEFAVILPDIDTLGAELVAESMREAVLSLQILHEASTVHHFVTVSVGIATIQPASDRSQSELIAAADEALYRAKRGGRNSVEAAVPILD